MVIVAIAGVLVVVVVVVEAMAGAVVVFGRATCRHCFATGCGGAIVSECFHGYRSHIVFVFFAHILFCFLFCGIHAIFKNIIH